MRELSIKSLLFMFPETVEEADRFMQRARVEFANMTEEKKKELKDQAEAIELIIKYIKEL
jgi:hypothetical protein